MVFYSVSVSLHNPAAQEESLQQVLHWGAGRSLIMSMSTSHEQVVEIAHVALYFGLVMR